MLNDGGWKIGPGNKTVQSVGARLESLIAAVPGRVRIEFNRRWQSGFIKLTLLSTPGSRLETRVQRLRVSGIHPRRCMARVNHWSQSWVWVSATESPSHLDLAGMMYGHSSRASSAESGRTAAMQNTLQQQHRESAGSPPDRARLFQGLSRPSKIRILE